MALYPDRKPPGGRRTVLDAGSGGTRGVAAARPVPLPWYLPLLYPRMSRSAAAVCCARDAADATLPLHDEADDDDLLHWLPIPPLPLLPSETRLRSRALSLPSSSDVAMARPCRDADVRRLSRSRTARASSLSCLSSIRRCIPSCSSCSSSSPCSFALDPLPRPPAGPVVGMND